MAHSIASDLAEILDGYEKEVREKVQKDIEQVAKETAKELKQNSPKAKGDYAKSWAASKQGNGWVVHNKKHYRLTHLLENGHIIKNQYGTYGRMQGTPHIKPAEDKAVNELVRKVEEDIKA